MKQERKKPVYNKRLRSLSVEDRQDMVLQMADEYVRHEVSFRCLGLNYGVSRTTVSRMLNNELLELDKRVWKKVQRLKRHKIKWFRKHCLHR